MSGIRGKSKAGFHTGGGGKPTRRRRKKGNQETYAQWKARQDKSRGIESKEQTRKRDAELAREPQRTGTFAERPVGKKAKVNPRTGELERVKPSFGGHDSTNRQLARPAKHGEVERRAKRMKHKGDVDRERRKFEGLRTGGYDPQLGKFNKNAPNYDPEHAPTPAQIKHKAGFHKQKTGKDPVSPVKEERKQAYQKGRRRRIFGRRR
tara:strand:+ start:107 stop:727 length:621 start_codon:yes stop_codon:yes gene_type:complete